MDGFWGTEYEAMGPLPADFVFCSPLGIVAISEKFRDLLVSENIGGLRFTKVLVDREFPMYILGIKGVVDVDSARMELALMDGAEIGVYSHSAIYVNRRLMVLMGKAKINCYSECIIKERP